MGAYLAEPLSHYLAGLPERFGFVAKLPRFKPQLTRLSYLILLSLVTCRIISSEPLTLTVPPIPEGREEIYYPVGAVEYIRRHLLTGRLLADFNWGEYLLWNLHPHCQVAIDGRYETVYPEEVVRAYMDFSDAKPGWHQFLEKYPPDLILIPTTMKIYPCIQQGSDWRQVYADGGCGLFVKRSYGPSNFEP
jgi:hypothetical protein